MNLKNRKIYGTVKAFTLIELLVVIGIIALLISIMVPVISMAKGQAKSMNCMSNLRQLWFAFACYADNYDGFTMPTCDQSGTTYWWGQKLANGIDHKKGFVWPYMRSELKEKSVFECPVQQYGTYILQGKPAGEPDDPRWITSTYGYNGYYLCPPRSGWMQLRQLPWKKIANICRPAQVIAFADTMLDWSSTNTSVILTNIALLDPPYILDWSGMYWGKNEFPTTCFRHNDKANAVFADGHCEPKGLEGGEYTSPKAKIGYIGKDNSPYYVPDYKSWPQKGR